jgi:hypothetical protein
MITMCHVFCAIMTHMYKMITIKQRLPNLEGNCHINSMHLTGGVVIQFVIQILAIKINRFCLHCVYLKLR